MTEETGSPPPVTLDIIEDEVLDEMIIIWRGTKAAAGANGSVDFEVFRAVEARKDNQRFVRRGDRILTGTMNDAGCADIESSRIHLCLFAEFQQLMRLLGHIYVRAFDLMGCEPNAATDPQGHGILQAAKQAREAERVQCLINKAVAETRASGIASIPVKA